MPLKADVTPLGLCACSQPGVLLLMLQTPLAQLLVMPNSKALPSSHPAAGSGQWEGEGGEGEMHVEAHVLSEIGGRIDSFIPLTSPLLLLL